MGICLATLNIAPYVKNFLQCVCWIYKIYMRWFGIRIFIVSHISAEFCISTGKGANNKVLLGIWQLHWVPLPLSVFCQKKSKAPEKSSCTNNRTCSHSKDRKGGIWPLFGWTWTDLNENRGNWILLGWTRSALVVFVHERNAYCSCSFLGTLVRITKVGIFSDDRGRDWLEWDTGIEVARSCIFVIASPFTDKIGEHYLFWRHFIIGLHF